MKTIKLTEEELIIIKAALISHMQTIRKDILKAQHPVNRRVYDIIPNRNLSTLKEYFRTLPREK
ncbi:hypothetical protein, partial [Bacillus smithii]|nr:hypothetical protein [Bacillus smithii]